MEHYVTSRCCVAFKRLCALLSVGTLPAAAVTEGRLNIGGQNPDVQEWQHMTVSPSVQYEPQSPGEHVLHKQGKKASTQCKLCHFVGRLPSPMAAIPEAVEGMQLSQRFSGAAQQLQADMDALKLSLATNDFGMHLLSITCAACLNPYTGPCLCLYM